MAFCMATFSILRYLAFLNPGLCETSPKFPSILCFFSFQKVNRNNHLKTPTTVSDSPGLRQSTRYLGTAVRQVDADIGRIDL